MKIFITLIFTCLYLALSISSTSQECAKVQCNNAPLKLYNELHCFPVNKNDCCPSYNCWGYYSLDYCRIGKSKLKIGQQITTPKNSPVSYGCSCEKSKKQIPTSVCGSLSKPAIITSQNNQEIDNDVTCKMGDKVYKNGEFFVSPESPEDYCFCDEIYKGFSSYPSCIKIDNNISCFILSKFSNEIKNNCAPVYKSIDSLRDDCPSYFECQKFNHKIKSNSIVKISTDNTCFFGSMRVPVGQEVDIGKKNIKCLCQIPPAMTCIEYEN